MYLIIWSVTVSHERNRLSFHIQNHIGSPRSWSIYHHLFDQQQFLKFTHVLQTKLTSSHNLTHTQSTQTESPLWWNNQIFKISRSVWRVARKSAISPEANSQQWWTSWIHSGIPSFQSAELSPARHKDPLTERFGFAGQPMQAACPETNGVWGARFP